MKKPLIVIAGPTACGKTGLSIKLAKLINGEIISGDSMQVYKYMDIGTAKATKEEMNGIKHYMIDEFYPDEEFNVTIFQKKSKEYMEKIYSENKIPILCGGTGFYINALVNDNDFTETENDYTFRNSLYKFAEDNGAEALHKKLEQIDPESAKNIHPNNIKRVARAIEFFELTKTPISKHNENEKQKTSPYNTAFIILNMDRAKLYDRIEKRIDIMVENGLIEEVKKLLDMGYSEDLVSMQGIGYKEIVPYIKGECSLDYAISELKKATRHFAKRQITWFKRQTEGLWVDLSVQSEDEALKTIENYIKELGII
ncbi:MAG: tRNA (adenosine(37)-N6)-dimethylallyltransferase MiaA [Tyzzerella sp.]|uniref:tRNA dimethylallyltransferase n=1 Tax=Candidatus Fimicola merdigallinarum TaxID=2840819 RepID=A0A9D9DXD7_9FIRM|nr:tRNA (adenosine(37)-N6)-dimethylallyltransferase MiaA [Candidatus Fimicola merdigallinarum]